MDSYVSKDIFHPAKHRFEFPEIHRRIIDSKILDFGPLILFKVYCFTICSTNNKIINNI